MQEGLEERKERDDMVIYQSKKIIRYVKNPC